MAIPPGPQVPFDKNRTYGQQPGFVSRHSGKIFITLAILVILGITWVVLETIRDQEEPDDRPEQTTSHVGQRFSTLS